MDIKELIRAGHGKTKADMVISNGNLINVASGEIYPAEVAIKGGYIVAIGDVEHCKGPETEYYDAQGKFLAPGMIDGHPNVRNCLCPALLNWLSLMARLRLFLVWIKFLWFLDLRACGIFWMRQTLAR